MVPFIARESTMSNDRLLALAGAVALLAAAAPAHAATTELVSVNTAGQEGNGNSFDPSLSGDGHYVAFESIATNLANGVGSDHVFVRDRVAHTTTAVDVSTSGQLASSFSFDALISRDGSHVAFFSNAANLVAGDTNGKGDVFERDLKTGTTVRVSVKSNGKEPHNSDSFPDAISANGRYVAFETRAPNLTGVRHGPNTIFVHNLATGNTLLISKGLGGQPANGGSFQAAMSGDGRFVVYGSDATNIVAGNNGKGGVFLWDRHSGQTVRVDVSTSGQQADDAGFRPFVSDDGNVVAFGSEATNLVSGVTDGATLVYVRDLKAGTTTLVSRAVGGGEPNDDVYLYGLSSDGRYVLMQSAATNMVAGDTNGGADDFVYDRQTGTMTRVDVTASGGQANKGDSDIAGVNGTAISADGGTVAFSSESTNLVQGDTNGAIDVFVRTGLGAAAARAARAR